MHEVYNVTE